MAKKCKIWMSSSIFDDHILHDTEHINPNSEEYHKIYARSRFTQIETIKKSVENLLENHKEIELEGFYVSSGATYYIALSLKREFEDYVYQLPMNRLWNKPNTCYERINLNETYEKLKMEVEKYADHKD